MSGSSEALSGDANPAGFNYGEPAELYGGGHWNGRSKALTYQRFDTAAEAIRHVMEGLDGAAQRACFMEVDEQRFNHVDVRRLYDSSSYPLSRLERKDADAT